MLTETKTTPSKNRRVHTVSLALGKVNHEGFFLSLRGSKSTQLETVFIFFNSTEAVCKINSRTEKLIITFFASDIYTHVLSL